VYLVALRERDFNLAPLLPAWELPFSRFEAILALSLTHLSFKQALPLMKFNAYQGIYKLNVHHLIRLIVVSAVLMGGVSAAVGQSSGRFGAIATSSLSGHWGMTYNYSSRSMAEREALRQCGHSDCRVRSWFQNQCAALVHNDRAMAWGLGDSIEEARSNALDALDQSGQTVAEVCSTVQSR
jgi:hypothetical protein